MDAILFFGLTTVDIFNFVNSHPGCNGKMRAVDQLVSAGGPAANASVACSALGKNTTLITGLGSHPLSELARSDLVRHGVQLHDWTTQSDRLPVLAAITTNLTNGERSVIYSETENRSLTLKDEAEMVLERISLLMFDGYYLEQAVQLAREAKKKGIPVVLDGGSWKPGLEKLLPYVTYGICSKDFHPPGCADLQSIFDYMHKSGIEGVAVTGGEESIYYRHKTMAGRIDVQQTTVRDTLGAGDILHGAFCAFCQDNGFVKSLEMASRVATESCKTRGTRSWIRAHPLNQDFS